MDTSDFCSFDYDARRFTFRCWSGSDHVLRSMRWTNTFYELDVLEGIRVRLQANKRRGAAVDAGAFIGTHSVFFAGVCGLDPVLAFEPHPHSYSILVENIRLNGLDGRITPVQKALSAGNGYAALIESSAKNKGQSSIDASRAGINGEQVSVCALDSQLAKRPVGPVALIKIDVEGSELEVLKGAQRTIEAHRPILCIEAHRYENLRDVLGLLRKQRYVPVDCLGPSPTYIFEASSAWFIRRLWVSGIWLLRARLRKENARGREYLRDLGRRAALATL